MLSFLQTIEVLCSLSMILGILLTSIMLFMLVYDDYKSVKRENKENEESKSNEED